MSSAGRRGMLLCWAMVSLAGAARADDLLPPRLLHTPGLAATPAAGPGCPPVPALGPRRPARLVVRDAPRPDVGPYTVRLPGYSTSMAPGPDDLYRPFLIEAAAGDTLRFDVVDQLAAGTAGVVNLHTHGLIVSPRRCAPFGDSVYVEDKPGTTAHYAITIPAKLPGAMFAGGGPDRPYPPGLNWFHAHVHGKARVDVMAGQSSILQVGDLRATLLAVPGLPPAVADTLRHTDAQYLGLRDIQLAVPAGAAPDQPGSAGKPADWLRGGDYDPGACKAQANPPQPGTPASTAGRGYCTHAGATAGGAPLPGKDTVWLFTINGQRDPTLPQQPGRSQLWRIANLSANVSYLLELVDDATGTPQDMDVVSLDGLVAGTSAPGSADLQVGVRLRHLLLMPAGRAEVFVPAGTAAAAPMTLRTAGITTGVQGDPWPHIDLAHVSLAHVSLAHVSGPPTFALQSGSARPGVATAPATASASLDMTLPGAAPGVPTLPPGSRAQRMLERAQRPEPANCISLPEGQATRRRITFANDASGAFVLGSEVVAPDGTPVDAAHTIAPQPFPMAAMTAPQSVRHVCPRLGEQEVWGLVNTTGELHNFHIQQSKFRLAVPSDPGVPQGPLGIDDPTGIIAAYVPEAQGAVPDAQVDVWHDTLPVPPADAAGKPGRVLVAIPFLAPQQVGFFVHHCHILEHEDGGMMAVVQVFDPAHPALALAEPAAPAREAAPPAAMTAAAFDQLARAALCGLPPVPANDALP